MSLYPLQAHPDQQNMPLYPLQVHAQSLDGQSVEAHMIWLWRCIQYLGHQLCHLSNTWAIKDTVTSYFTNYTLCNGKAWNITKGTPVSYFCMGRDPTLQWHRRKEEKQETKVHSLFFKSQTSYIIKNLQSGRGGGGSKSRPKCKLTSNCFYLLGQISCACP